MAVIRKTKKIGEILVDAGLLTNAQIEEDLNVSKRTGARLGRTLVNMGIVTEEGITQALAQQLGISSIPLAGIIIESQIIKLIPEILARKHKVIPIVKEGNSLKVAMFDPLNVLAMDDLKKASGCEILPLVARASDIHIEPDEDTLRIRMRVDGILHEMSNISFKLHPAVISRVKILSGLDIAEKRLPQDGRFNVKVGNADIDIRLSTLPTLFGEKAVLRLLNKSAQLLRLEELTPLHDTLVTLKKMIAKPYGMIL